ncbi:unnamed protein product [Clavelina lepadiformis]|uniref:MAGUK p55 subfamily member 7 n=1 Tax=Clavelina lepadiformis TaxID=159417 RepID=A0ABP0FB39_CLALP
MPLQGSSDGAIQAVLDNLGKLPGKSKDTDVMFLKVLMDSPVVQSLARAHDTLDGNLLDSVTCDSSAIAKQVIIDVSGLEVASAAELCRILHSTHLQSILTTHDAVAKQRNLSQPYINEQSQTVDLKECQTAVRMVGLSKRPNEPLGLTVTVKNGEVVVSRILHGGLVHRQGLLHVGDTICEINGESIKGKPDVLQEHLSRSSSSYIFKIIPSYKDKPETKDIFMKSNFDYSATDDEEIPCKDASLSFKRNEILKVVDRSDRRWWQALHVNDKGEPVGRAGLIPSLEFQERRRIATNKSPSLRLKKKPNMKMYKLSEYYNQHTDDFPLYEEVALLPPFNRKVFALVSDDASVAYNMQLELVVLYPSLFKYPVIHTSCVKPKGNQVTSDKEKMATDIKSNEYLEYTEVENELYGTKYSSIRDIMKSQKICVKDVAVKNLKLLMTSEFMPYVIFLQTKTEVDSHYPWHSFNKVIHHVSNVQSVADIYACLHHISTSPQWVPVSWFL